MYVWSFSSIRGPMCSWEMLNFAYLTSFQKKMTSAGLNSLWQKKYQTSVKRWILDDPFHKKGLVLVIWVLGMIKPSGSVIFLMKWGCRGHWGCWGHWGHWGCRSFKAWKTTTEDFRVIQAFEFSFIFMFRKKIFGVESWNIILNFSTFSVGGCWGQLMSFFLKTGWWNTNVQSS